MVLRYRLVAIGGGRGAKERESRVTPASTNYALCLIDTDGKQRYVFDSNKLRESVGASELIHRVGTTYIFDALKALDGDEKHASQQASDDTDTSAARLTDRLLDHHENPPLETAQTDIEIIVATSSKAVLLVRTRELAERLVTMITYRALREAPGLTVRGVVREFDFDGDLVWEALKRATEEFESLGAALPGSDTRFQRLPFAAECATTGLPAADLSSSREPGGAVPRSETAAKKRQAFTTFERRQDQFRALDAASRSKLLRDLDKMERSMDRSDGSASWIGVLHLDGNGLGSLFRSLHRNRFTTARDNRNYLTALRNVSCAVALATERSFARAVGAMGQGQAVVPLVLGGDDLTVLCTGPAALPFARAYLDAFESQLDENWGTITHNTVREDLKTTLTIVLKGTDSQKRLAAAGGIALTKPHFPFHLGYGLAEALLRSAKQVKTCMVDDKGDAIAASAIDVHVLSDTSGADLDHIRTLRRDTAGTTKLWGGPYLTTDPTLLTRASTAAQAWAHHRRMDDLVSRAQRLGQQPSDATAVRLDASGLPSSLAHRLREVLFASRAATDNLLALILDRYPVLNSFLEVDDLLSGAPATSHRRPTLFWTEKDAETTVHVTRFLDAMDLAGAGLAKVEEARA